MRREQRVQDLADVLQRERGLLEQLRYRFVALELLLEAREARFLTWATQDVERARRLVREADLARAASVGRLNLKGARGIPSLREVAAAAPSPWSCIMRDHHDSMCSVVTEIELHGHRIAQTCRDGLAELAHEGTWHPAPMLMSVDAVGRDSAVVTLPAPGQAADLDPGSIEHLLHGVLTGGGRLQMPALLAFLR